jgi:hypothetical protein
LATEPNEARARAEARFRKEERAKESAKAMVEYQANNRRIREKTERLKALGPGEDLIFEVKTARQPTNKPNQPATRH